MSTESPVPLLEKSLKHLPSYLNGLGTIVLAMVIGFGNFRSKQTHDQDEIETLKTQVSELRTQVANDLATRRELVEFKNDTKDRLTNIEGLLQQELKYHRGH